jgi:hypothetical protein
MPTNVQVSLNVSIEIGNRHIFPPESQVTPPPAAIAPYLALLTPSPYRTGMYIKNAGDIIRG